MKTLHMLILTLILIGAVQTRKNLAQTSSQVEAEIQQADDRKGSYSWYYDGYGDSYYYDD
jgi:hypothetical protein